MPRKDERGPVPLKVERYKGGDRHEGEFERWLRRAFLEIGLDIHTTKKHVRQEKWLLRHTGSLSIHERVRSGGWADRLDQRPRAVNRARWRTMCPGVKQTDERDGRGEEE